MDHTVMENVKVSRILSKNVRQQDMTTNVFLLSTKIYNLLKLQFLGKSATSCTSWLYQLYNTDFHTFITHRTLLFHTVCCSKLCDTISTDHIYTFQYRAEQHYSAPQRLSKKDIHTKLAKMYHSPHDHLHLHRMSPQPSHYVRS